MFSELDIKSRPYTKLLGMQAWYIEREVIFASELIYQLHQQTHDARSFCYAKRIKTRKSDVHISPCYLKHDECCQATIKLYYFSWLALL